MAASRQMRLLLWKNWVFKRRKWKELVAEILFPIMLMVILLMCRLLFTVEKEDSATVWPPFTVDSFPPSLRVLGLNEPSGRWRIVYAPDRADTSSVMRSVADKLEVDVQGFDDESDLVRITHEEFGNNSNILCGVVFMTDVQRYTRNIRYKLRFPERHRTMTKPLLRGGEWMTAKVFPFLQKNIPRNIHDSRGGSPGYAEEGFLAVQHAIDMSITKLLNVSSDINDIKVRLVRFPFPPAEHDMFTHLLHLVLPMIILLCYGIGTPNLIRDVVLEKEKMLKEYMRLMGLGEQLHWISWMIEYLLIFGLLSTFLVLVLGLPIVGTSILRYSDLSLLFVFLILYALATIMFCFLISCMFSKASRASLVGVAIFFLSYVPYSVMTENYRYLRASDKVAGSLLHNVAMSLGCRVIANAESMGEGVRWSNLMSELGGENLALGAVLVMLLFDSLLYGILAMYMDAVIPGDFGLAKPWYFPFAPAFWPCGKRTAPLCEEEHVDRPTYTEHFEPCPADVPAGIKMRYLRKEFQSKGSATLAVVNTNLDIKENEITVLLGQNGAGKSTTLSMITGVLPPTKGTVYINNVDIKRNPVRARSYLGVCPQQDVLFDLLTVEEHIRFYSKLKGASDAGADIEVRQMIEALDFMEYRDYQAHALSGGWKRRLSVAIALIGDPKVVILDEPTTGMDPEARRKLWQYLSIRKSGRTTLITTHALDEAEAMGDRIAIMADGVLKCCGSTLFLREKYDCGYELVIEKSAQCNVAGIQQVVAKHVEEANMSSDLGPQLTFSLPPESTAKFEALFEELDDKKESLFIANYGVHATTLDDVFLRIGSSQSDEDPAATTDAKVEEQEDDQPLLATQETTVRAPLPARFGLQLQAMVIKRALVAWRSKYLTLTHLFCPLFFIIIACVNSKLHIPTQQEPSLALAPHLYSPGHCYLYTNDSHHPLLSQLNATYRNVLLSLDVLNISGTPLLGYYPQVTLLEQFLLEKGSISPQHHRYAVFAVDMHSPRSEDEGSGLIMDAYFNNQMYHTPSVLLSVLDNILLRVGTGVGYNIETSNHPFPPSKLDQAEEQVEGSSVTALLVSVYTLIGYCFVLGSFSVYVVQERYVKAKHLQLTSGLHTAAFWLGNAIWDMVVYSVICVAVLIVCIALNQDPYVQGGGLGATIVLFLAFALSAIPLVYVLSRIFKVATTAYNWITFIFIITGFASFLTRHIDPAVEKILMVLLPNLSFLRGLRDIYVNYHSQEACEHFGTSLESVCSLLASQNATHHCCHDICGSDCLVPQPNYFAWESPGVGQPITFLVIITPVIVWTLLIMESTRWRYHEIRESLKARTRSRTNTEGVQLGMLGYSRANEDEDVMSESQHVWSHPAEDLCHAAPVLVMGLTKHFANQCAVDNLTFKVSPGECFGLLGANGAGKTTVFEILTGNQAMSSGQVYIGGFNIISNLSQARKSIGYCPQSDALLSMLTARETLSMYGRIRGLSGDTLSRKVEESVKAFMLGEHANKRIKTLSGGTKRKLSLAVALIGEPPIVFLDEPTSGMDPVARKRIWSLLLRYRDAGRTMVLTSHSMLECETLCTRLAIMVNGQFKCIGTNQHLKQKFGHGYSAIAKVACSPEQSIATVTQSFISYIHERFPGCSLQDAYDGTVHFRIATEVTPLPNIFNVLEYCRANGNIVNYSVSQTTLEQVFLFLARSQIPPRPHKHTLKLTCSKIKSTWKRCVACQI